MSTSYDRNTGLALIIVQGYTDEEILAFIEFCNIAQDYFSGIKVRPAKYINENDVQCVKDWIEQKQ